MTQAKKDYEIVFKKLEQFLEQDTSDLMSREEFEEINELRRLSLEVEDPEPQFHTTV